MTVEILRVNTHPALSERGLLAMVSVHVPTLGIEVHGIGVRQSRYDGTLLASMPRTRDAHGNPRPVLWFSDPELLRAIQDAAVKAALRANIQ